jgi:serine/threonine protein kinase/predicted Zn-dependent protease
MKASADLSWIEVDDYVAAFERAWNSGVVPAIQDFVAAVDHPQARSVLVELIRVDLECRRERNLAQPLGDYLAAFPECRSDSDALNAVAFEDYRLRTQAGESITPRDYEVRYGCRADAWPKIDGPSDGRALSTFVEIRRRENRGAAQFPVAGDYIAGFELLRELGRGAFSRVFLARQGDLAGRKVVVKISTLGCFESDRLAKLQHSQIVPVYSVHHTGHFSVVCMPYLGEATFADLLQNVRAARPFPGTASLIRDTARATRHETGGGDKSDAAAAQREFAEENPARDYVTAVLRLAALTADGLTHAHQRGILHRDIKPANILLSTEGSPMLLDFNLSEDLTADADPLIGGTLPYMAPEQLQAYVAGRPSRDPRSDLFSLGVVLYELLTGRHPFPLRRDSTPETIAAAEIRRWSSAAPVHQVNPSATPAVSAIVERCLAFRPDDRYSSAAELADDLRRQLNDLPLRHAPNASLKERVHKWGRRHPRLTSAGGISLIAAVLIVAVGCGLVLRTRQLAVLTTTAQLRQFETGFKTLQSRAVSLDVGDSQAYQDLVGQCRDLLGRLHVWSDSSWWRQQMFQHCTDDERERLRSDVGETLFLMSAATRLRATSEGDPEQRRRLDEDARGWLERSQACYSAHDRPKALQLLQASFEGAASDDDQRASQPSEVAAVMSVRDSGMIASLLLLQRRPREALPYWQRVCRAEPGRFWGQFGLGSCYEQRQQWMHAAASYSACIALDGDSADAYFRRGICHLRLRDFDAARADFDVVLRRRPLNREALLNRASTWIACGQFESAIVDLNSLLATSPADVRAKLMLATAYERQGNRAEADRIRAATWKQEITDPDTLVARGVSRVANSPREALADFDLALRHDAIHLAALESKAHVLSERLGNTQAAIETLERAIVAYPEEAAIRSARGVLLARQGMREEALREAERALELDSSDAVRYQVAGIHALLADGDATEERTALGLLASALRRGYGLDLLERDPDLEPLRTLPAFSELRDAAATLNDAESRNRRGR